MSATEETTISDSTAANAGGPASVEAPAPGSAAPTTPADPWDSAFDRAAAKLAAASDSRESAVGAMADEAGTGETAITQTAEPAKEAAASADDLAIPASSQASTAAAPEHWPADVREEFEQLPEDSRARELAFHNGMQSAFTQGMQGIRQRERELGELVNLQQQFRDDPRAVLEALAKQADVPLWFEQPLPKGEMPKFETIDEALAWNREQTLAEIEARQKSEREARDAESRQAEARVAFKAELESTAAKYPDFATHREGILSALAENPALPVEHAYRLATYDGLRRLAAEGQAAQRELTRLEAQREKRQADATRPGPPRSGTAVPATTDPWERAWQKAQERVAQKN